MPSTRALAFAALIAAAFTLSACGKKGPLDTPEGGTYTTVAKPDGTTKKVQQKPRRPFVLDGLLN